jgi:signal transduction histidine kinase
MRDYTIPEPTREEIWQAYKLKVEQNQITVAIAASILQSFWYVCDYILFPEARLQFFFWRIAVLVIPIIVCLLRHKLKISASACLFFSGLTTALMISIVLCSSPESIFQTYVFGYAILFVAAGALANLDKIHSVLFPIISFIFNAFLFYYLSPIDSGTFLTNAIVPIYSCAFIGYLMIESRKKMQLKEIKTRMEIERSRKVIESQKDKLNEELDNFVYSVSHDLRSPLLSVKGILTLLYESGKIDPSGEKYLRMAESSIDRLDNTIQDILEYSRNSRLDVKREWFDMSEVVKQIFDDIQFISETPIQFEINIDGESNVYSDKTRVTTIIKNLVSNAAKYRKLDTQICYVKFHLWRSENEFHFEVSDNGIGIPKAQIAHVFTMFYRVSTERVGTGLGLFIVQEITDKLGGRIHLESEVDRGTTVRISIAEADQGLKNIDTE